MQTQDPRGGTFLISFVGLKIQVFEQDLDFGWRSASCA